MTCFLSLSTIASPQAQKDDSKAIAKDLAELNDLVRKLAGPEAAKTNSFEMRNWLTGPIYQATMETLVKRR